MSIHCQLSSSLVSDHTYSLTRSCSLPITEYHLTFILWSVSVIGSLAELESKNRSYWRYTLCPKTKLYTKVIAISLSILTGF